MAVSQPGSQLAILAFYYLNNLNKSSISSSSTCTNIYYTHTQYVYIYIYTLHGLYIYIYVLPVLPVCAYIHIYIYVLLEGVDLWLVSEYGNITLATAPSCASIAFGQVDRTEQLFRLEEADGAAANDERNPRSKKGRKPGQYIKIWGKTSSTPSWKHSSFLSLRALPQIMLDC